jgi:hypothetical protein
MYIWVLILVSVLYVEKLLDTSINIWASLLWHPFFNFGKQQRFYFQKQPTFENNFKVL